MIKIVIFGEAASKANSRRVVKFGGRPSLIKSAKAIDYEKTFLSQIPDDAKQMLQGELRIDAKIYYSTQRPDLDESLILDCLQAKYKNGQLIRKGIYSNDRQVREKHIYHGIDKNNPRAEIVISKRS